MSDNIKIEYNKETGETELTVKLAYNLKKLYDMSEDVYYIYNKAMHLVEYHKYRTFIDCLVDNGYKMDIIRSYPIVIPKPQLVPYDDEDFRKIRKQEIRTQETGELHLLIDVKGNDVVLYRYEDGILRTGSIQSMCKEFCFPDGTKFEKEG